MRRKLDNDAEPLRCSFCRKRQEDVGKLISSPSESSRAYICDECVAVCARILEDEREEAAPEAGEPHPLVDDPLASELIRAVEAWVTEESLGKPAAEELGRVREVAGMMLASRPA